MKWPFPKSLADVARTVVVNTALYVHPCIWR